MQIKDYIPYKVKTGDTLKSLAARIGLDNYKQLRHFHNRVCTEIDYLKTEELIKGNTLYVPDIDEVNLINKTTEKETAEHNKIKPFRLQFKKFNASYKVEITKEEVTGSNEKKNIIGYTIDIKHTINKENLNILRINKTNFLINKKKPKTKMQQIALQCSKSYFPVNIILNKSGEMVGINNMAEIKERWLKNKVKIQEMFTGHYANKYINNVNYKILETNQLESVLINDVVLNTLLLPYKRLNRTAETTFNSTFLKHKINYKVSQIIEKDEKSNKIILKQEGLVDDIRSYKEILAPEANVNNPFFVKLSKIEGTLNNTFTIDMEHGVTNKIRALYKVNYTPNKCKITSVNINLINK
ncbi:hypothetical protein [Lacinutrix chionoecetis]